MMLTYLRHKPTTIQRKGLLLFIALVGTFHIETTTCALTDKETACFESLKGIEPNFLENINLYDDSSQLTLSQTGTFVGTDDILEYAQYFHSEYYADFRVQARDGPFELSSYDNNDNTDDDDDKYACSALFVKLARVQLGSDYSEPTCIVTAGGEKIYWTLRGSSEFDKIKKLHVYLPGNFMYRMFSQAFDNSNVRDSVCNVMKSEGCTDVWAQNNLTDELCHEMYDALPLPGPDGYLDDNTSGCRLLHTAFAGTNPDHCPHLSFIPMADRKGRIKCQTSSNVDPTSLFTDT